MDMELGRRLIVHLTLLLIKRGIISMLQTGAAFASGKFPQQAWCVRYAAVAAEGARQDLVMQMEMQAQLNFLISMA